MLCGNRVRFYRHRLGKTQEELAFDVGVTSSYLSNIENGRRNPSPKIITLLADALSVRAEELWENDGSVPIIPISAAEKGIVLEHGVGFEKTRFILPPTSESYDIVARYLEDWKKSFDPRLQEFIDWWERSSENSREYLLSLIKNCEALKES
jgi:transcriptional regulator with XRE-family HTH domain